MKEKKTKIDKAKQHTKENRIDGAGLVTWGIIMFIVAVSITKDWVFLSILLLLSFYLFFKGIKRIREEKSEKKLSVHKRAETSNKKYNKIGGWLILPVIGLVISPVLLLDKIFNDFLPVLFNNEIWNYLTLPTSEGYHPMWAAALYYEFYGNIAMLIFIVIILIFFFKKHKITPVLMIFYLIANLMFVFFDQIIIQSIPSVTEVVEVERVYIEIVRAFISAAIWIPYFIFSKRVKGTFTK